MNELEERAVECPVTAKERIAEISRMFVTMRDALQRRLLTLRDPESDVPEAFIIQLNELKAVHLRMLASEEAFHDDQGQTGSRDQVDLSEIRAEIGGRLDRLRATILTDRLSAGIELCPACRASLSL